MGGALNICERDDESEEYFGKLHWEAPTRDLPKRVRTPVAKRAFAAGECVEKAYCLRLDRLHFASSPLTSFLYPVPGSDTGAKLFPLGWGLLYNHSESDANLVVEYVQEIPQPAPQVNGGHGSQPMSFKPEPRDFLVFTAMVEIEDGDELFVAPPNPTLKCKEGVSVVDVMARYHGLHKMEVEEAEVANDFSHAMDAARKDVVDEGGQIGYLEADEDPVVLGASPVHGLGVFAARDILQGEVITVVPNVPLAFEEEEGTPLDDYVFKQDDFKSEDFTWMQLGVGPIFNHSDNPNIQFERRDGQPFLTNWVTTEFVPEGQELCHDYGDGYWKERREVEIKDCLANPNCEGVQLQGKDMRKTKGLKKKKETYAEKRERIANSNVTT